MTTQVQHKITRLVLPEVGNTPLLYLASLSTKKVKIFGKAEWQQPSGSVKARAARRIIACAIHNGKLSRERKLLDASSGNTAIAYATLLRPLGWHPVICLPSNASKERKEILRAIGAELILTSPMEGTDGARIVARELAEKNPDQYYYADQYSNPANWQAHYHTTAAEIWQQTKGKLTHFIAGLGTTGTFTGTSLRLKELGSVRTVALQPDEPLHPLEGWKHLPTAHVPEIYRSDLADDVMEVNTAETFKMIRWISEKESLMLSPSSAANLQGAVALAEKLEEGLIVTTLSDTLDRYGEVKKEIFNT